MGSLDTIPTPTGAETVAVAAPVDAPSLATISRAAQRLFEEAGRPDLVEAAAAAASRADEESILVAILGEFKQGKSSLVNGLLGEQIAPVDDDLATAVPTVFRYGAERTAAIHQREGDAIVSKPIAAEQVAEFASERGRARQEDGVLAVEVSLPNPFLSSGLTIIDTPGFASIREGYDDLTLASLRTASGALFVSDASAPLTPLEVTFLAKAGSAGLPVVCVMTKTDLYGDWERTLQIDRELLERSGVQSEIVAVSAALRMEAFAQADASLNDASGFPELLERISAAILDPATAAKDVIAQRQLGVALVTFAEVTAAELAAGTDPGGESESLRVAAGRLDYLRAAGGRWGMVMSDGYSDLVNDVDYRFRARMRQALRETEERIEVSDPKGGWEELAARLRVDVSAAVRGAVDELVSGAEAVNQRVVETVASGAEVELPGTAGVALDALAIWRDRPIVFNPIRAAAGAGYAGLRGAQGGIVLLGVITHLAGLALTTGATIGVGAIFGGKQLLDERNRQVANRRVQARTAVRTFADDVQFEMGKGMRDLGRDLQRGARDSFNEQITSASRSLAATIQQLSDASQRSAKEQSARAAGLQQQLAVCGQLQQLLAALASPA